MRGRLAPRLVIAFAVVVGATLAGAGYLNLLASLDALERELGERLVGAGRAAALSVDPAFLLNLPPPDESTPDARAVVDEPLRRVREATGVRDIVVIDREGRVLASATDPGAVGSADPTAALDRRTLERVWEGETAVSPLYEGLEGVTYKSAWVPVEDRGGEVRAVCRAELPADFPGAMSALTNRFVVIGLLGAIASILAGLGASRWIVGPVRELGRAMDSTGPDGLPRHVEPGGKGELADLGRRFNRMVDALRAKDRELRALYARERARAERIEDYASHLLAGIQSGVVGVDASGEVVLWNEAAAEILGAPGVDEAMGEPLADTLPDEHPVRELVEACLSDERRFDRAEEKLPGEPVTWVGISAAPIFDREGGLIGSAAIFTDLTRIRELQREIARRDRLSALGELSAGLAHEIRNPLGALRGYVDLLHRLDQDGEAADLTDRIREEIEILNRIVVGFLDFARGARLDREPVDLAGLADRAAEVALDGRDEGAVELRRVADPSLPEVPADPVELRKAVLNLVQNAVQAMEEGGTLTLRTEREGDRAVLEVVDTGPGIPEDLRDRIFNPFFTTREEGTGLGLAIAHRIVRAHGGDIRVHSPPDGGTSFRLHLPLEQPADGGPEARLRPADALPRTETVEGAP